MTDRLKRNLTLSLGLAVSVYLVLAIITGVGEFGEALAGFRWALFPAALGLVALSYVGRFGRWTYYLWLLKVSLPLGANAAIFTAGLSMTISPGKMGEVLKSLFIKQVSGDPVARTAPAVVAERATDGIGMVLWGLVGALAFSFGLNVLLVFSALAIVGIAVLRSERLNRLAERELSRVPLLRRLAPHLRDFHGASNRLLAFVPLAVGTAFSFFSWGLEIAAVYLCVVGLGLEAPFLAVVFIFAISSLIGAASMLPGGIGAAEAGLTGMFTAIVGVAGGVALALTFLIRLATLWFATLIGVGGLLVVRKFIEGKENQSDVVL